MTKFFLATVAVVLGFAVWSAEAPAADPSVHFALGYGTGDSVTYDLYLKHTFMPLVSNANFELKPITNLGVTLWEDTNSHDTAHGIYGAFGLQLNLRPWTEFQPYLAISGGPSYFSEEHFVGRDLGGYFLFNTHALLGVEFGKSLRHNLNVNLTHYSNGHTYDDNDGLNSVGLAYGYSF